MRNPETSRTVTIEQLLQQMQPYQTEGTLHAIAKLSEHANTPIIREEKPVISFADLSARLQGDESFEE